MIYTYFVLINVPRYDGCVWKGHFETGPVFLCFMKDHSSVDRDTLNKYPNISETNE